MYAPDLSGYVIELNGIRRNVVNIGWLSADHPYTTGDIPQAALDRLLAHCLSDNVNPMKGDHTCELCPAANYARIVLVAANGKERALGAAEIRVYDYHGAIYAAPNLIYHYVTAHNYCPPERFIEALLLERSLR